MALTEGNKVMWAVITAVAVAAGTGFYAWMPSPVEMHDRHADERYVMRAEQMEQNYYQEMRAFKRDKRDLRRMLRMDSISDDEKKDIQQELDDLMEDERDYKERYAPK